MKTISLKVTDDVAQAIKAAAKKTNSPNQSEWIRRLILKSLRRIKLPNNISLPDPTSWKPTGIDYRHHR